MKRLKINELMINDSKINDSSFSCYLKLNKYNVIASVYLKKALIYQCEAFLLLKLLVWSVIALSNILKLS